MGVVSMTWIQALLIALSAYLAMSVWLVGVGYFTAYRPLIGGTIVGLILGDVQQGMAFCAMLNAVHLGFVSTGGTLPSDLVMAGYAGTALALASGLDVDAALAAFGIPLGVLGGFLWFGRMTLGSLLVHWADARAERGDTGTALDYARAALARVDGVELLHAQPVVREFAVRLDAPVDRVIERCAAAGVNPGYPLGADYDEYRDGLLIAITEQRTREDIDRLAAVLGEAVAAERKAGRPEQVSA